MNAILVPIGITIAALVWALIIDHQDGGYFAGAQALVRLIPALGISLVAWIAYAVWMALK